MNEPNSPRRRVLILIDYFEPGYKFGGPVTTMLNTIETLHKLFEFFVITRNTDFGEDQPYNVPIDQWIEREYYKVCYKTEHAINRDFLKTQITDINPDKIYLCSFFSWRISIQTVVYFPRLRHRMIVAGRGELAVGALSMKALKKQLFLSLARITGIYRNVSFHASSPLEASDIERNISCKKILVAPDLVSLQNIKKKEGYEKQSGSLNLCFISRIVENKNLHFCIRAVSGIVKRNRKVILDIYGLIENEEYWSFCKKLINDLELGDVITYKGALLPAEVKTTFSKYDFFFFASLSENFGHVIFESLSVGTPVIISDTTFWSTMLSEPQWGFVFPSNDESKAISILDQCVTMNDSKYIQLSHDATRLALKVACSGDSLERNIHLFS